MVSSSTPTSSRRFDTGGAGWGLKEPRPNHPSPMGNTSGFHPSASGDHKPIPVWAIVILVIVLSSMFAGLGYMLWLTFKPTMSRKDREEARREIDLERASLEAEAKWQRSLRQAEMQEMKARRKQKGDEIEMEETKSTKTGEVGGEKVVVGKLGKTDDVV